MLENRQGGELVDVVVPGDDHSCCTALIDVVLPSMADQHPVDAGSFAASLIFFVSAVRFMSVSLDH
jgi:hypothetical protein